MSKKKRNRTLATVLAVMLLSSGTFAWQSISQLATNEMIRKIDTPGARLHDYFDGSNKDVFVENYAQGENAPDVYARIKLSEYFEYGLKAGTTESTNATILRGDIKGDVPPLLGGKDTWDIYDYTASQSLEENIRTYRDLFLGGETIYLPTFNRNNTDASAEQNGTFLGTDLNGWENRNSRYDDYTPYVEFQEYPGILVSQDDTVGSATNHTATKTANATIMSMEQCLVDRPIGDIWVFDETGWAYYAKPIEAGSTTGLLLDGIKVHENPREEWYYAIEVTTQLATYGDWGVEANDENAAIGIYEELTPAAMTLLNVISGYDFGEMISDEDLGPEYTVSSIKLLDSSNTELSKDEIEVTLGDALTLKVEVTASDGTNPIEIQEVEWGISKTGWSLSNLELENTFIDGVFKPVDGMDSNSYILTAKSLYDEEFSASVVVKVLEDEYKELNLSDRYTYSILETEDMQDMYKELALGIYNRDTYIYITSLAYDTSQLSDLMLAVRSDYPEFFWMPMNWSYSTNGSGRVTPTYEMEWDEIIEMKNEIDEAEAEYLDTLSDNMTDYDILLHTFQYVIDHVSYEWGDHHQTLYGALVEQESVCAGYTRMFQYLIMRQGINVTYISGVLYPSGENHGWNMVKLDNEYYYVDTTLGDGYAANGRYNYYYMMQSYANVEESYEHKEIYGITGLDFGRQYNYAVKNQIYFDEYNVESVKNSWANMYLEGQTQFYLEFANDEAYQEAYTDLTTNSGARNVITEATGASIDTVLRGSNSTRRNLFYFITYNEGVSLDVYRSLKVELDIYSMFD